MKIDLKNLVTFLLALAVLIASARCTCALARPALAMHCCCQSASTPAGHHDAPQPGCAHCGANAIAATGGVELSPLKDITPAASPIGFADVFHFCSNAPPSPPHGDVALSAPPPDVLLRRGVLQL